MFEAVVRHANFCGVPLAGWIPLSIGRDGYQFVKAGGAVSGVLVVAVTVVIDDLIFASESVALMVNGAILDAAIAVVSDVELEFEFEIIVALFGPDSSAAARFCIAVEVDDAVLDGPAAADFLRLCLGRAFFLKLETVVLQKVDPTVFVFASGISSVILYNGHAIHGLQTGSVAEGDFLSGGERLAIEDESVRSLGD